MGYETNYSNINKYLQGGLVPVLYDSIEIVRNVSGDITAMNFHQNNQGANRKVVTIFIEYVNGYKSKIYSVNYLTTEEIMP